ncbi:MAG: hypothetical protein AVDCRST_MAG79-3005, partial [uncultured Thermoleophilia bacterium]
WTASGGIPTRSSTSRDRGATPSSTRARTTAATGSPGGSPRAWSRSSSSSWRCWSSP